MFAFSLPQDDSSVANRLEKGRHLLNQAVRGIQLLRTHVSVFAARQGTIVEKAEAIDTSPMTPHGGGWYHEHPLRLEKASPERIRELLEFSVMDMVKTVLVVCAPHAPDTDCFSGFHGDA